MRVAQKIKFRPRLPADDPFILSVGKRVFARWSRDPAQTLAAMLAGRAVRAEIAERDREAVGFAIVTLERLGRAFGPWRSPVVARLDAIAVAPGQHGRGVGKALLARAEAIAIEEGAVVMALMTAQANVRARRLFAGGGFLPLVHVAKSYANGDAAIEMFKLVAPF